MFDWVSTFLNEWRENQRLRYIFQDGLPPLTNRLPMQYMYEFLIFVDNFLDIDNEIGKIQSSKTESELLVKRQKFVHAFNKFSNKSQWIYNESQLILLNKYLGYIEFLLEAVNKRLSQISESKITLDSKNPKVETKVKVADLLVEKISIEQVTVVLRMFLRGSSIDAVAMLRFIVALNELDLVRKDSYLNLVGKEKLTYQSRIFYEHYKDICKEIKPYTIKKFSPKDDLDLIEKIKIELKLTTNN